MSIGISVILAKKSCRTLAKISRKRLNLITILDIGNADPARRAKIGRATGQALNTGPGGDV
jgi:hypothetical protein